MSGGFRIVSDTLVSAALEGQPAKLPTPGISADCASLIYLPQLVQR